MLAVIEDLGAPWPNHGGAMTTVASTGSASIVWRVNMGQAYQAGVWERGQRSTSHPYLMYRVGPSREHREQHLAWDGLVLPKDDPFWSSHNPRNGWGCKCSTRFVSRSQFQRYERDGITAAPRGDRPPAAGKPIQTEAPERKQVEYYNPRTDTTYTGYEGIDPGFEYNPGAAQAREDNVREQFRAKDARLAREAAPVPSGTPVDRALDVQLRSDELRAAAERTVDAITKVHGDGDLPVASVIETGSDNYFGGFLWFGDEAFVAISSTDASHPELTVAHEIGHFLDFSGMPGDGFQSEIQSVAEMRRLVEALEASPTAQAIARLDDRRKRSYLLNGSEMFARSYSQYIAWRSGDERMREQLDRILQSDRAASRLTQWGHGEFAPIAAAFDELFLAAGWLTRE